MVKKYLHELTKKLHKDISYCHLVVLNF